MTISRDRTTTSLPRPSPRRSSSSSGDDPVMCRGIPRSLVMRRRSMITGVGLVCVWVLDMDEARSFYVDTLGLDVTMDMEQDGIRWLLVNAPAQPEVPIMLVNPASVPMDSEIADQIRSL